MSFPELQKSFHLGLHTSEEQRFISVMDFMNESEVVVKVGMQEISNNDSKAVYDRAGMMERFLAYQAGYRRNREIADLRKKRRKYKR